MNKSIKLYLIVFGVVLALLAFLEVNKTEVINWQKSFDISSTSPYGLFIFNEQANKLFNQKLERTSISPYEFFSTDSSQGPQNLLIIDRFITTEGWNKIFKRVAKGDQVFIMGYDFDSYVMDSLEFNLQLAYSQYDNMLELIDEKFKSDSIYISKVPGNMGVGKYDSTTTRILGSSWGRNVEDVAVFIEVTYGKGKFYFHTEPLAITNFYLLEKDNFKYTEDIFSYLPDRKTIWFQENSEMVNESPLRFILSQKPLRYAWYLGIFSLILFVIFHAKRRQRMVPVIEPLKNSSAEFVKTIGNLYLQEGNPKDMANKKAIYFLNKVRTELLIDTKELDATFIHRLQLKTGADKDAIEAIVTLIKKAIHPQAPVQQDELLKMNTLIDEIYQ